MQPRQGTRRAVDVVGALAWAAWRCVFDVETYGESKRNSVSEAEGGLSGPVPAWSKLRRLLFEASNVWGNSLAG